MKFILLISISIGFSYGTFGQVREIAIVSSFAKREGSVSLAAGYDWELWKKKKFAVGTGLRFTSYIGANQYYQTAPAKLTSGGTGPLVIFKENIEANIDTFLIPSPQVNFINAFINIRYQVSTKIHVGFNIDLIGFSVGRKQTGNYINRSASPAGFMEGSKPTLFNVLLISDNDRGSLNSEIYVKYYVSKAWAIKAGACFLFTEYTTDSEVQQKPEPNDRFRNKSLMAAIGLTFKL